MNNPPPPVPYAYPYSPYYSSHYAHAYSQIAPQLRPATTSSASSVWPTSATNKGKSPFGQLMSTWYRPGNVRCSYPGCTFYGSLKSVEIHRMDRHLIYPPDWEKSRKLDWDADLSLKGYGFHSRKFFGFGFFFYKLDTTGNPFRSKAPMLSWTHLNLSTCG